MYDFEQGHPLRGSWVQKIRRWVQKRARAIMPCRLTCESELPPAAHRHPLRATPAPLPSFIDPQATRPTHMHDERALYAYAQPIALRWEQQTELR